MAYCEECGRYFPRKPDETWKTLCIACFKESKRQEKDELHEELDALREENDFLQGLVQQLRENLCTHPLCRELLKHQRFLLKRLHPDVNGNSEESTAVTRLLLDLNEKARELAGGAGGQT